MAADRARERGLTSTVTFLRGGLAPEGALVKSTAISPAVLDADGVFLHEGPARVFTSEGQAIAALKSGSVKPGDVMVLAGIGPGCGMPETYQVTSALKHVKDGQRIALITDGRFSGVSTGACIGHISPEAWAGGTDRQIARRRSHPAARRHAQARGYRGGRFGFRRGTRRPADESGAATQSARARRHAVVGGAAKRERRQLGGLRL